MDNLETGKDKIKKICEILKTETLEPAKAEAQQVIHDAKEEAERILQEARKKAAAIEKEAYAKQERDRRVFEHSLTSASKQALEALRQAIEKDLFNTELSKWMIEHTAEPSLAKKFIETLVNAIEKEGISADFSASVARGIPTEKVNALLLERIVQKLKEKSVVLGDFQGGVRVKLNDKQIMLDLSDSALSEILQRYLRKDFRALVFKKQEENE